MSLRFHEIAEKYHTILNPLGDAQLDLIGEVSDITPGMRHLDLACGKGEMLIRFARRYQSIGVGVDISEVFIAAARERAAELEVADQITFVVDDAAHYPQPFHEFDIVSCIGATWIGNGLLGTLELMRTALKPRGGTLLVGEPYWHTPPTEAEAEAIGVKADDYATLAGTLERFNQAGLTLVEMTLASLETWDRYEAPQWRAVYDYLRENPDDPEADTLRAWIENNKHAYLNHGRRLMGWGIFVLREPI